MTEKSSSMNAKPDLNERLVDEIDLKEVAKSLLRHKFLIAKIVVASVVVSGLYAFTRKPIWEGQFEIVLASKQASQTDQLLQSNRGLATLIGASGGIDQLETEVKILKSPSVLKPVFDFVKRKKQNKGEDVQQWRYTEWRNDNLEIKLVQGTYVLELAYRDTDKEIVLPVIQRISEAYQSYSGRDRERGIKQAITYLDQQINIYGQKSKASLRAAQEYGIEQELTTLQGKGAIDKDIKNSLNIEAMRIEAANQIRNIDEQLKQLKKHENNPEILIFIGRIIPSIASQDTSQTLNNMDTRLALLRANYTDKDDNIRRLLQKRRLLIDVLKRQTYGYLFAQRTAAQARLKATERPKGVLIKYRELLRTAERDEETLKKLESERQILALEQARKETPWELISTPTLLDTPVAPSKRRIVTLGFIGGLLLGCGAGLLNERRKNLVFSIDELQSLLPCRLLKQFPTMAQETWADEADLIASGPLSEISGENTIALIPLGDIPSDQLQAISAVLKRALLDRKLLISTDLRETSKCATQLLVTAPGIATRTQIAQLCQKLALQRAPLAGWILLDPELNPE